MSRPLSRYTPSRRFVLMTLLAICGAALSAWMGLRWTPSWIAAGLFAVSAGALAAVTLRPALEIHEDHLAIGRRAIPWTEVRRVDQTGWKVPLAVRLTLAGRQEILVIHAGDADSSVSLLRHLRRFSRLALLDGVPYRQFWGEPSAVKAAPPELDRYPLLRPEDEQEIERMFQRLKSVGRTDARGSDDK